MKNGVADVSIKSGLILEQRENPRSSSPNKVYPNATEVNSSTSAYASGENDSNSETYQDKSKRPGFFARTSGNSSGGRNSPNKKPLSSLSNSSVPTTTNTTTATTPNDVFAEADEALLDAGNTATGGGDDFADPDSEDFERVVPSTAGSEFVLVESPSSKARALKALQKEQQYQHHKTHSHSHSHTHTRYASANDENGAVSSVPANRTKYLPTPPVAPVMPDFNDIMSPPPPRKTSPMELGVPDEGGLRRKTSMVKKLKDRINK